MGGFGAALYCGTGCFHRRESLIGKKYSKSTDIAKWDFEGKDNEGKSVSNLEESSKLLASCSYEKGTQWGKEVKSLISLGFSTKTNFFCFCSFSPDNDHGNPRWG